MTLKELIIAFRRIAHDEVEPYFWTDEGVTAWLNEALCEAVKRGRLLFEHRDTDVCVIPVHAGEALYPLHPLILEIAHIRFHSRQDVPGNRLRLCSEEALDREYPGWRSEDGIPGYAIQHETTIRLIPRPSQAGDVRLEAYRLPRPMKEEKDEPEIHPGNHLPLLQWVLFRAFSVPDTESFDPERSRVAALEFERYFGLPVDSDFRRKTREDTPHRVMAFMP